MLNIQYFGNIKFYNFGRCVWKIIGCSNSLHRGGLHPIKMILRFSLSLVQGLSLKGTREKIFFTGENVQPSTVILQRMQYSDNCVNEVDLSLGFDYLDNHNYLRFLLWMMYIIPPNATLSKIKTLIENINNQSFRLSPNRNCFSCQISRHDVNGIRIMVYLLNNIDHVTCVGNFINNSSELHILIIVMIKLSFFKIFESILGRCIPMY